MGGDCWGIFRIFVKKGMKNEGILSRLITLQSYKQKMKAPNISSKNTLFQLPLHPIKRIGGGAFVLELVFRTAEVVANLLE